VSLLAVTVIGHDRPGIIAEVTGVLARVGTNLEDSSMTLLRGHFAMTLICAGNRTVDEVEEALAPVSADGKLLVSVRELPQEPSPEQGGSPYVLSLHGGDRPGIVSAVTKVLGDVGGNVTDLTTRLTGDLYVLVAEADIPPAADIEALQARLAEVADELGVEVTFRPLDADVL
jgi:glycine cleavage system transcriptional repressor